MKKTKKKHTKIDMNKIAKGLGAERRGKVQSGSGYFGAQQLAGEISARKSSQKKRKKSS